MPRKSTGAYPPDWKEIAKRIKDEAGWKCQRCGHPHAPKVGYTLTVHHLDLNKSNCAWWNLPALCQRCHLQIQGKVIMERAWALEHSDWFRPFAAGYYAAITGLAHDRATVAANQELLLAFGRGDISLHRLTAAYCCAKLEAQGT